MFTEDISQQQQQNIENIDYIGYTSCWENYFLKTVNVFLRPENIWRPEVLEHLEQKYIWKM